MKKVNVNPVKSSFSSLLSNVHDYDVRPHFEVGETLSLNVHVINGSLTTANANVIRGAE